MACESGRRGGDRVKRMAVIGAGTMGRGIAYTGVINGFEVALYDISESALQRAKTEFDKTLRTSADKGFITQEQLDAANRNLTFETDMVQAARNADIVIEAVLEKMDLKIEVFRQLDGICPPRTILATNTSTLSPTEIGAATSRADRCIAMHFFNPVHKMKLVEIIRGLDTSDDTYEKAKAVAARMKKETVEVNEFPGFVTSRMNCLIGNEAMNMLMEGVASAADIDKAIKLGLNHPMGPLELADLVGLDTRLRNMEYLHQTLGEKYRPSPILLKYVKAGRLGRKSGRGFYQYSDD